MFNWTVSHSALDLSFANVFYLQVFNGEDNATTHYFNITSKKPTVSPTSTLLPPISSTAPVATIWHTATAEPDVGDKPLTTGTLVGIIVGVVAAIICLLAGAWLAVRVWKKKKDTEGDAGTAGNNCGTNTDSKKTYGAEVGGNPISEVEAKPHVPPVHEVGGR
ncbi:hypothetical protein PG996_011446 [Apiospora saccharicola]|uniref:Mid2 domain-containing protein n=1 Tax=Apiospora saccharicola TaxID=335842 RepID=A0ABR1UF24_9PEZI